MMASTRAYASSEQSSPNIRSTGCRNIPAGVPEIACTDARARTTERTLLEELAPHLFRVRHVLVDPDEDNMWFAEGRIDLRAHGSLV